MNNLQTFEGDLLLEDTPDGGDIRIENNLFVSDRSFNTAVYLSLFGGNKDDNGKVKNNEQPRSRAPGYRQYFSLCAYCYLSKCANYYYRLLSIPSYF
jgi:hypothetical protein